MEQMIEQARELIDYGNAKEKAEGRGMMRVLSELVIEKNVMDAIAYFEVCGYIEELTTDKRYYVETLIDFVKKNKFNTLILK